MKQKLDINLQFKYNFRLIQKLQDYLISHADVAEQIPNDSSYVVFSARNKTLNKLNQKLVDQLLQEGKKNIIKAEETRSKDKPWKLTFVSA